MGVRASVAWFGFEDARVGTGRALCGDDGGGSDPNKVGIQDMDWLCMVESLAD